MIKNVPKQRSILSEITEICFISFQSSLNCTKTNERTFMICRIYREERPRAATSAMEKSVDVRRSTRKAIGTEVPEKQVPLG